MKTIAGWAVVTRGGNIMKVRLTKTLAKKEAHHLDEWFSADAPHRVVPATITVEVTDG